MALTLTIGGFDFSNYIAFDSVALKLNTLDLALIDPAGGSAGAGALGAAVVLSSSTGDFPTWNGTIGNYTAADISETPNGHFQIQGTAVNSTAATAAIAPFDLSDAPSAGLFELENGSGHILLEDGLGSLLTEGSTYGYQRLSVHFQKNTDATTGTFGSLRCFQRGLWPGQTVNVKSNTVLAGTVNYTITVVAVTYPAGQNSPVYDVEFGTTPILLRAQTFPIT